ncbi:MAG: tRNA uridine-5-carboxymethylaminomethyl(34) synthesis enzyme MnmG, partial [Verrucomicrobiota bacterium]
KQNQKGGRMGDTISTLSDSLKELGLEIERFKTGTPCRLNGRSIDFSKCDEQTGDDPPPRFSFLPQDKESEDEIFTLNRWNEGKFHVDQLPCWITWTNPKTHDVIRENLDKSPMYSGMIEGIGPRYCPSIEDKVVKFAEKERHQVFLEPEGRQTTEYYVNGVSTSLPYEVQYDFLRSIPGLENCEIIRPGYAVEYDYCVPTQLLPTLETKKVEQLYLAGQINGTSGYEEAGGQGLMAGINAALKVKGEEPFLLGRSDAYIGVMIDDLVTKGTTEPYRMFTSRAEYRILLRQDNSDLRLTPKAFERGIVPQERGEYTQKKAETLAQARELVAKERFGELSVEKWFKRPENAWESLPDELKNQFSPEIWDLLETDVKYEGYIRRQEDEIARTGRMDAKPIPDWVDFLQIRGLKTEAQHKLNQIRPTTLGQAGRISGITPADISLLAVYLERGKGALAQDA